MHHLLWLSLVPLAAVAAPVELAGGGRAAQSIVVGAATSGEVRTSAETLAAMLERISGAPFEIVTGDGTSGIAVGRASDFPALELGGRFAPDDSHRREEYLLRSHPAGLQVIGATELAVQHAVWDLLGRLGYRQYFPGPTWEVVPQQPNLRLEVDAFEQPDYHSRRIWYGYGVWDYNADTYADWCAKNRALQGIALSTGHSYDRFVSANKAEFEAHPEYWPLLDGERKEVRNPKPCLGNPAVRRLFVEFALSQMEKDPTLDSISMDPSDGGGWCECDQCAALGTVTDQALTAANEVAAALQEKYPGTLVGMYAYNYHSPPPTIQVHPNVVISVATAFIKGGLTLDDLLAGWSEKGATLGIREYYGVNVWDRDQPAGARGGNLDYLFRTIPEFHAKGARFMSSESSDNWGPNGLGYWLAGRLLWDVDEAGRRGELVEDFLTNAFGPAAEPMRAFYDQLDGSKPHLVADDQLHRMFAALEAAYPLADTAEVRSRLDDLTLYSQYASLYHQYATASGEARQAAFEALIRHAYRMRTTSMVHTKALYRDLVRRDKTVTMPDEAQWNVAEADNPWKSSEPFVAAELADFRTAGLARHPRVELAFEPVDYSTQLVPAAEALGFPMDAPTGTFGDGRGVQTFYTYVKEAPGKVELTITGGLIPHYRDRGNVKVELWQLGGASATGEAETLVATDASVPPDGEARTIALPVTEPGVYKVTISDGNDKTRVAWPEAQPMTVRSTQAEPMNGNYGEWTAYFYVPRGTKVIGLFGGGHGEIRDSQNRPHLWLNGREPNYHAVDVPEGEDGKVWKVQYGKGAVRLLTVPPYLATTPAGLLVPAEVVAGEG